MSMRELYPFMKSEFDSGRPFRMVVNGTSMLPLIRGGRDTVVLKECSGRLQKYDIPLYIRSDGSFVLHRVVGVRDGAYIMCGDNQVDKEYGVLPEQVKALMYAVVRDGKYYELSGVRYRLYCLAVCALRPLRRAYSVLKNKATQQHRD